MVVFSSQKNAVVGADKMLTILTIYLKVKAFVGYIALIHLFIFPVHYVFKESSSRDEIGMIPAVIFL